MAMKKKLAGTDEYLLQWAKGKPEEHEGSAVDACQAVAEAIEARYDAIRADELGKC